MHLLDPIAGDYRYNIEGFKAFPVWNEGSYSHTQIFTNGAIEYFTNKIQVNEAFAICEIEVMLLNAVARYFELFKKANIIPPFVISLSLHNCKGIKIYYKNISYYHDLYPPKSNYLNIPEIVINSMDVNLDLEMKPLFDGMWRVFGAPRSDSYHENGLRKKNR